MAIKHKQPKNRKNYSPAPNFNKKEVLKFKQLRATPTIYNLVMEEAMSIVALFRVLNNHLKDKDTSVYASALDDRIRKLAYMMDEIDSTFDYTIEEGVKKLVKQISGDEKLAIKTNLWTPPSTIVRV